MLVALRNKFHPYASACIQAILDKFKEKKSNVVTALREAADAIYPSVSTVQCWWRSGTSSTRTRPPAYKPYSTSSRRRRATLSPRSGRLPTLSILVLVLCNAGGAQEQVPPVRVRLHTSHTRQVQGEEEQRCHRAQGGCRRYLS
ncbi:hypothetical protein O0L34_g10431 [Tuta absoluta]|nr:hypothetical protein O0L34_g10431 [Tuta absoluta]